MQPDSRIGTESAHYGTGIVVLNDRNCQFSEEKTNVVLNLRGPGGLADAGLPKLLRR
jgi:hypothetical protein